MEKEKSLSQRIAIALTPRWQGVLPLYVRGLEEDLFGELDYEVEAECLEIIDNTKDFTWKWREFMGKLQDETDEH